MNWRGGHRSTCTSTRRVRIDGEELGDAATRYVSTEVAGGFTGAFLGLYATGPGARSETPATVERFVYES
ncbi:MAG: hypothetical protein ABEJ68_01525 [Halobacteriaceae archaeon]